MKGVLRTQKLSVLGFLEMLDNTNVIVGESAQSQTLELSSLQESSWGPRCHYEIVKSRADAVPLGDWRAWASAVHHCGF